MRNQGHRDVKSTLFQNNESAIKLEKNWKSSSSGRTRHINIKYFFIKDVTRSALSIVPRMRWLGTSLRIAFKEQSSGTTGMSPWDMPKRKLRSHKHETIEERVGWEATLSP